MVSKETMKKIDVSMVFLVVFAIAICVESYKLGLGRLNAPEPGLFPFLIGLTLGVLAAVYQLLVVFHPGFQVISRMYIPYRRIAPAIVGVFAYSFVLTKIGFIVATFLFVFFLLKVTERKSWGTSLLVSAGIVLVSYFLFRVWLGLQLPSGLLGL
jgi:putative tricarboxylic transport membrane protein